MNAPVQPIGRLLNQLCNNRRPRSCTLGLMEDHSPSKHLRKRLDAISKAMIEATALPKQASKTGLAWLIAPEPVFCNSTSTARNRGSKNGFVILSLTQPPRPRQKSLLAEVGVT